MYPIIMAGGSGTRLWPISKKSQPKQVYPIVDKDTLLQKTWKRMRYGFSANDIFISTGANLASEVEKQLRGVCKENIVSEPSKKGTAPALGLALLHLYKKDSKGIFVYINADNFVKKEKEFIRLLGVAEKVIKKKSDHTLLIGVNPTYPETGYGYIKMGKPVMKFKNKDKSDVVFEVNKFIEKPDLEIAKKFVKRWEYFWNPTLIVGRVDRFLDLYKKHLPATWKHLEIIQKSLGTDKEESVVKKEFAKIKPETIDYGILEKEKKMFVMPGNFGWTDVGHWKAVYDILAGNKKSRNVCKAGKCISVESEGNLVYSLSGKLVALAGIKNMILIESENALLLCPKNRAQDVKKLVENLEKRGLKEYL